MTTNYQPRFTGVGDSTIGVALTTGNTTKDGTAGTTLLYTAPTDGALVTGFMAMPLGTNVASVLRIFLNNGSTNGTAANNCMVAQVSLPATTNSEVAALAPVWVPLPRQFQDVKATYGFYGVVGTTVAAGWMVTPAASKFATA